MTDRLITPQELADYLGIPLQTIYQWRVYSRGPRAIKVGRHIRYRQADIDSWLEQQAS